MASFRNILDNLVSQYEKDVSGYEQQIDSLRASLESCKKELEEAKKREQQCLSTIARAKDKIIRKRMEAEKLKEVLQSHDIPIPPLTKLSVDLSMDSRSQVSVSHNSDTDTNEDIQHVDDVFSVTSTPQQTSDISNAHNEACYPPRKALHLPKHTRKVVYSITKPTNPRKNQQDNATVILSSDGEKEAICQEEAIKIKEAGRKRTRKSEEPDLPPMKHSNFQNENDKESTGSSAPLFSEYPISSEVLDNAADEDWYTDLHAAASDHCQEDRAVTEQLDPHSDSNKSSVCKSGENITHNEDSSVDESSSDSASFLKQFVDQPPMPSAVTAEDTIMHVRSVKSKKLSNQTTLTQLQLGNSNGIESSNCVPPASSVKPQELVSNNDKTVEKEKGTKTPQAAVSNGDTKKLLAKKAGLPTYKCVMSIRKKADRAKLDGQACASCNAWYAQGKGIYKNSKEHLKKTCRHKHLYPPADSDPSLWKIGFPDTED